MSVVGPKFWSQFGHGGFRKSELTKLKPRTSLILLEKNGTPERIRTSDPQIRSLVLYPAELRVLRCEGGHIAVCRAGCKRLSCTFLICFIYPACNGPGKGRSGKFPDAGQLYRRGGLQRLAAGRQDE